MINGQPSYISWRDFATLLDHPMAFAYQPKVFGVTCVISHLEPDIAQTERLKDTIAHLNSDIIERGYSQLYGSRKISSKWDDKGDVTHDIFVIGYKQTKLSDLDDHILVMSEQGQWVPMPIKDINKNA